MACRLHPAPGFIVGQVVIQLDRAAQVIKRFVEITLAVTQFSFQHGFGDVEDISAGIVKQHAGFRYRGLGGTKIISRRFGSRDVAGRGTGHRFGILYQRACHRVEIRIVRQALRLDFIPHAETDQHMLLHRVKSFDPVGH